MRWIYLDKRSDKGPAGIVPLLLAGWVLMLLCVACSGPPVTRDAPVDTFTRHLDETIPTLMKRYSVPGLSIALVRDRELVWTGAYGYADVAGNKEMSVDAVYRAESISKPVTAWGVVKLAEKGLINLDAPIMEYLADWEFPESDFDVDEITIRKLLSNSAGVPLGSLGEEYAPHSEKPSLQEYLLKEVHIQHEPGAMFEYSNPGFNLLELLIVEVTGRDFSEFMQDEVLIPLRMDNSSFTWSEQWSSKVPMGYDLKGRPVGPYVYPYKASGGLFATVGDIARFAMAGAVPFGEEEQHVLSADRIRDIQSPQVEVTGMFGFVADSYGFGHFIETLASGQKAVWHGGQGHGWMTHFHLVPETGDAIVLFTNSQRSWPLMSNILKDWSTWEGYGPVKFTRIETIITILWALTALLFLFALYRLIAIIHGVKAGRRRLSLRLQPLNGVRMLEFLSWVAITSVLVWSVNQEYLFISSIFPLGSTLLGWVLLLLSAVLLFSILFPGRQHP